MKYQVHVSDENVVILPGAQVVGDVQFSKGCSVWYNAVIRADAAPVTVGENTNIQDGAVLHTDPGCPVVLGGGVTVGHGAIVHGCTVGDRTMVGMGAILLTGAKVGKDCIIGAGALVTGKADIPDGSMVLGSPAKVVRPLTDAEKAELKQHAADYAALAGEYR